MTEAIIVLVGLLVAFAPVLLGLLVGTFSERRHLQNLAQREEQFRALPVLSNKSLPRGMTAKEAFYCSGNVVLVADRFKALVAGFIGFFGGRIVTYETLLERARREAILRLQEEARHRETDLVLNLRLETTVMGRATGSNGITTVEVLAYGTAIRTGL
jgi:uncharacterized protein YbjQ (UPF0145 family)